MKDFTVKRLVEKENEKAHYIQDDIFDLAPEV